MAKNRGIRVEPHIYRRVSGGFFVRIRKKSGEICRVVQTLADARLLKHQLLMGKNGVVIPGKGGHTLKGILDAYSDRLEKRGKNADSLKWLNAKIVAFFGEHKPAPLTDDDLEEWAQSDNRDYIRRGLVTIRTAHRRAKLQPPGLVEYEFEPGHRIRVSEEQAVAFINELPWGSPERVTAELMLRTGARMWHVLALKVSDTSGPFLIIRSRKGRGFNRVSTDEYPITDGIRRVLESIVPPNAPADRLVIQINGRPVVKGSLRKRLIAASRRAKITPEIAGLAWIRNFTATRLREKGFTLETVSRMMGHSNVATTQKHYDNSTLLASRISASEAMGSMVGTGPHQKPTEVNEGAGIYAVAETDPLQVVDDKSQSPN